MKVKKEIEKEEKADFKKFLIPKDKQRKNNYIGDSVIAEREEADEGDHKEQIEDQKDEGKA